MFVGSIGHEISIRIPSQNIEVNLPVMLWDAIVNASYERIEEIKQVMISAEGATHH